MWLDPEEFLELITTTCNNEIRQLFATLDVVDVKAVNIGSMSNGSRKMEE